MAIWEQFENECTDYLNNKFGDYAVSVHQGGSDSTVPDILVKTKSGDSFYIEAKHSPAQCGQFVLLPNIETRSFEYSKLNVNIINEYAEIIMSHMNESFDEFREAGTAGKDITFPGDHDVFSNWIVQSYKDKRTAFFITNNYTILPVECFGDYFDVTAKYRIKRSGSGNVGKNRLNLVLDYINSNDYPISNTRISGDKIFVTSTQQLHNQRFILNGNEYMFSLRDNEYEVRKLSNTYNANVIFSIRHQNTAPGLTDAEFIDFLK